MNATESIIEIKADRGEIDSVIGHFGIILRKEHLGDGYYNLYADEYLVDELTDFLNDKHLTWRLV